MEKRILLLTHGDFASGIQSSLELIVGPSKNIFTYCMTADDRPETITEKVESFITDDESAFNIVLTDIPFGSTTQKAFPLLAKYPRVKIVSGLNLALLLEVYMLSDLEDFDGKIKDILENAKNTLVYLNDLVKE